MAMQSIDLSAERRAQLGTRAARRLRREGRLPAVVYGHHQEVLNVTVPLTETLRHVQDGAHLFSLKIDGGVEQVLLKDVQYDHLGIEILHLDLFRVNLDEEITSEVAIHLFGEPAALKAGGTLSQTKHDLEVICKVRDIPEELRVDVSKMEIGDALHVSDITLPPGVRLADPDEADVTIATLAEQKAEEEIAPAEEGPAEPEIIGRKAEEAPAEGEAPAKAAKEE